MGDEAKEGAQHILSEYILGAWADTVTFTAFIGTREASVASEMSSCGGYVDLALPGISRWVCLARRWIYKCETQGRCVSYRYGFEQHHHLDST